MTTLSRVINGEAPVAPDFYDDDPQALSAACKEWLLETGYEDDVSTQKITSNRKKFKKHLICEYEQWERLNGVALSEIYDSCAQSIQLSVGKKRELQRCGSNCRTVLPSLVSPWLMSRSGSSRSLAI
jgi:hypothetical protein